MPCGSYIRTNSERRCCFKTDRPSLSYEQLLWWMLTKSSRAAFIGLVREMAGLTTKEHVTAELQPSRVRRDRRDLNKVMEHIKKSLNPFQIADSAPKILVNLNTGKAASQAVRVPEKGRELHNKFISECQEDPSRFERPIKKAEVADLQGWRRERTKEVSEQKDCRT